MRYQANWGTSANLTHESALLLPGPVDRDPARTAVDRVGRGLRELMAFRDAVGRAREWVVITLTRPASRGSEVVLAWPKHGEIASDDVPDDDVVWTCPVLDRHGEMCGRELRWTVHGSLGGGAGS